jgi:phosphohistidine phosphatase
VSGHRLYLLRHAKSSWKDPALADHDRPLNSRGRRAAKAIGRHMRDQGIEPELVLCSPATRARETLERIGPVGHGAHIEPELYGAGVGALLARLHEVPAAVPSVMVIGHNPGLQDLALFLSRWGPGVREPEAKFPTAGLATLAVPGWSTLDRGTAELIDFVRPRDLE